MMNADDDINTPWSLPISFNIETMDIGGKEWDYRKSL